MSEPTPLENIEMDANELIAQRRAKLEALRAKGNAYPNDFHRNALAADLHANYENKTEAELESDPKEDKVSS